MKIFNRRTKPELIKETEFPASWELGSIDEVLVKIRPRKITVIRTEEEEIEPRKRYNYEKIDVEEYLKYIKSEVVSEKLYLAQVDTKILNMENQRILHKWSSYSSYFWFGRSNRSTSLHFDYSDNYNFLLFGKKRWVIIDPKTIKRETTILRNHHTVMDPSKGYDKEKYPYFETASYTEFIQEKNDVVYVPRGWWHMVETLEPSFAINHWDKKSRMLSRTISMKFAQIIQRVTKYI